MSILASIPQEVLEHVAFFAATDNILGPPDGIVALLSVDRRTHAALSMASNPFLWSRIFAHKFDTSAALQRLSDRTITPQDICEEFKLRCTLLKRIRRRTDSLATSYTLSPTHRDALRSILWMAYLMMLENEGRNDRQLREYAGFDAWLKEFLFHPSGASLAAWSVKIDLWPPNDERSALALWLFWYMLRPDEYMADDDTTFREASGILKLFSLGAHQYPLCTPPWNIFAPPCRARGACAIKYFGVPLKMTPPAPAPPAILAYLTLANKLSVSWDTIHYMKPPTATPPSLAPGASSAEWHAEWTRGLHLADTTKPLGAAFSGAFVSGSLEGTWEGLFTYTEFTAYAALLSGAPPTVLQRSLVAHHPHLWKLREHHLYAVDGPGTSEVRPLAPGNPLRGYLPNSCQYSESSDGVTITESGREEPVFYTSLASLQKMDEPPPGRLADVFITGEGHSAWGQFNLVGRVRPCDGFIILSKEYVDGDRGRWLYRGFLVGNAEGNLSGRWRDTLSPTDVLGYEGCFVMNRRR
ncbi:uncharacterized protein TRAVEDRAFT_170434 [Trametes versicolor FP-101664 SS1]|uniref:uncharacterized protein n=1 Tax=Trametes versicolor (strain FP-101664) TaxID=717944 RepID=UPI000462143C|nr:uncharacterized protein TRAVEDRAFT_170434 [Trametes versicolor FP-101664 SS1]EIW56489.1 hypothetical protein TRAVEDRAFT_170434 [Trametes versicolor FP-101664 SS1]